MSIFKKKFDDLTFEDVEQLVAAKVPESVYLDYKEDLPTNERLSELMSAFANTYGGFIVVGVSEDGNNLPENIVGIKKPLRGIEDKIDSICIDRMFPPLVTTRRKVVSDKSGKCSVLIVQIPESDLTPHGVDNNTCWYLKVGSQKRPVSKDGTRRANLDEISWLSNRRQKAIDLRNQLVRNANDLEERLSRRRTGNDLRLTISLCPQYPRELLIDHTSFTDTTYNFVDRYARSHRTSIVSGRKIKTYDRGFLSTHDWQRVRVLRNFTCFGYMSTEFVWPTYIEHEELPDRFIRIADLARFIMDGVSLPLGFLKELGYSSSVVLSIRLENICNCYLHDECGKHGRLGNYGDSQILIDQEIDFTTTVNWPDQHATSATVCADFISRLFHASGMRENISLQSATLSEWAFEDYFR